MNELGSDVIINPVLTVNAQIKHKKIGALVSIKLRFTMAQWKPITTTAHRLKKKFWLRQVSQMDTTLNMTSMKRPFMGMG